MKDILTEMTPGERVTQRGNVSVILRDEGELASALDGAEDVALASFFDPAKIVDRGSIVYVAETDETAKSLSGILRFTPDPKPNSAYHKLAFVHSRLNHLRAYEPFAISPVSRRKHGVPELMVRTLGTNIRIRMLANENGSATGTIALSANFAASTKPEDLAVEMLLLWGTCRSVLDYKSYRKESGDFVDIVVGKFSANQDTLNLVNALDRYTSVKNLGKRALPTVSLSNDDVELLAHAFQPSKEAVESALKLITDDHAERYGDIDGSGNITLGELATKLGIVTEPSEND